MKSRVKSALALTSLIAAACTPTYDQAAKTPPVQAGATTNGEQCKTQATSRLSLFDRPDTYPISADEKRNAYLALYNECMKTYEVQASSPKPNFEVAAAGVTGAGGMDLANLSPAAGGNAGARNAVNTLPGGVMIIDTAQFANLSPAAGGANRLTGLGGGVSGNGSTVVVVQAAPSTAIAYPPAPVAAPTHAAAIPVQRTAVIAPDAEAAGTNPTGETEPVKPRKTTHAKTKKQGANPEKTAKYAPSRFEKNAVPVTDLNSFQPSAGSVLDTAINTDRAAPKD